MVFLRARWMQHRSNWLIKDHWSISSWSSARRASDCQPTALLRPLQRSLGCWAVEGREWLAQALSSEAKLAASPLLTEYGSQECRMKFTPLIHRRSRAKGAFIESLNPYYQAYLVHNTQWEKILETNQTLLNCTVLAKWGIIENKINVH